MFLPHPQKKNLLYERKQKMNVFFCTFNSTGEPTGVSFSFTFIVLLLGRSTATLVGVPGTLPGLSVGLLLLSSPLGAIPTWLCPHPIFLSKCTKFISTTFSCKSFVVFRCPLSFCNKVYKCNSLLSVTPV